ncbi:hypothetical protein HU200_006093 [Digitaria exilis]|uniref:Uncharacterized protein n=1 Tax=Digitaria exilis TaxID=1010633 RepID=A0A835KS35_9POAL|nr:hypothetical protein HU200_006093 [Digitaria exilis]
MEPGYAEAGRTEADGVMEAAGADCLWHLAMPSKYSARLRYPRWHVTDNPPVDGPSLHVSAKRGAFSSNPFARNPSGTDCPRFNVSLAADERRLFGADAVHMRRRPSPPPTPIGGGGMTMLLLLLPCPCPSRPAGALQRLCKLASLDFVRPRVRPKRQTARGVALPCLLALTPSLLSYPPPLDDESTTTPFWACPYSPSHADLNSKQQQVADDIERPENKCVQPLYVRAGRTTASHIRMGLWPVGGNVHGSDPALGIIIAAEKHMRWCFVPALACSPPLAHFDAMACTQLQSHGSFHPPPPITFPDLLLPRHVAREPSPHSHIIRAQHQQPSPHPLPFPSADPYRLLVPHMAAPAAAKRRPCWPPTAAAAAEPNKRHRTTSAAPMDADAGDPQSSGLHLEHQQPQQEQPLLPGLPDHLAQLCLAPLTPRLLHAVCRPWRRLLYTPSFPPFLSLYAVLDGGADAGVSFAAYDAIAGRWDDLPSPPSPPPMLWHPAFLSRRLPLQSVAAAGRLVLVAGSTHSLAPALPHPVVFDPSTSRWRVGPRFPFSPRRWCAAGSAAGKVFVAGGVGAGYDARDARSGAVWDPSASSSSPGAAKGWEAIPPMRHSAFSRDAAEAVCSGGKVCMVSLRSRGAKEGAVFDLGAGRWEDMPPGMLAGWKGPAAAGGGGDETIFVVDEERGALMAYEWGDDRWRTVVESERLKGAAEMAAGGGKVCVAAEGGAKVIVVDVTSTKTKRGAARATGMWEVAAPEGKRVVALHVLPRMTRSAE